MARKARSTSKARKVTQSTRQTSRSRETRKAPPKLSTITRLEFRKVRFPKGTVVADTPSFHYAIKPSGSDWELRIYERTNGSGEGQNPGSHELFSTYDKKFGSQALCMRVAQAFHNLGDSFNEFAHGGYRNRFTQAILDAEQGAKAPTSSSARASSTPVPPAPATAAKPRTSHVERESPRTQAAQPGAAHPGTRPPQKQIRTVPPKRLPTADELRQAGRVARKRVYVNRNVNYFHTSARCRAGRNMTHWCKAGDAYRNRVRPCPTCSTNLAKDLQKYLDATASMNYPELRPLRLHPLGKTDRTAKIPSNQKKSRSRAGTPGRRAGAGRNDRIPHGTPSNVKDTRFSHRTAMEWGTSSFRQHPEEFLGTPTEDDHDWRGRHTLYE